jgi:hypothetical protein
MPQLDLDHIEEVLCQKPFIHDPGNGPRVRDTRAFLASSYFSQPPALDVRHPGFDPALESRLPLKLRSHYVPNSHKTRCYRCYAPSYQRKLPWWVPQFQLSTGSHDSLPDLMVQQKPSHLPYLPSLSAPVPPRRHPPRPRRRRIRFLSFFTDSGGPITAPSIRARTIHQWPLYVPLSLFPPSSH